MVTHGATSRECRERTEVLLAGAAGELFHRLPPALRARFADVPRVIKRLEADAALGNIRLDLIRLSAGLGSPDDLTADLEKARTIGATVDAEVNTRA